MNHPVAVIPDALKALYALNAAGQSGGVPHTTHLLVILRASQINGCSVCVDMHARELKEAGETDQRVFGVAAWRDAPFFSNAERAALALAECVTRLSDRPDPVPDDVWQEAAKHFDEKALAGLLLALGGINVWNRLNVSIRQPVGAVKR